jgi:hypothetical protein
MENRVTRVFVAAFVVNCTYAPVPVRVTARRPDASPARSPTVRFGPTTTAPPPMAPSSASSMSYAMLAPRPTNSDRSLVLLARREAGSAGSAAMTVRTVYRPFAAVQVPRLRAGADVSAAMTPFTAPVNVRTTVPASSRTMTVTACAPPDDATVPWLRTVTANVTGLPACGVPGAQLTAEATRSAASTGRTVSGAVPVYALFVSSCSTTVFSSSTFAVSGYVPAARAPIATGTATDAPAASAPTAAEPAFAVPR